MSWPKNDEAPALAGGGASGATVEDGNLKGDFTQNREVKGTVQDEARRLLAKGFKLCEMRPFEKRPKGDGWNLRPIKTIDDNATGYGVVLAANSLGSLDPDDVEPAREGLRRCGFDLEEIMEAGVRTSSTRPRSGGRSAFKVPPDLQWIRFAEKRGGSTHVLLELRAGSANLQDCLPGTVYRTKDGGGPYRQDYANGKTLDEAPELPPALLDWWRRLGSDITFKREQQALFCGGEDRAVLDISGGEGGNVVLAFSSTHRAEFNRYHPDASEILARHGYTTGDGERWAPASATGAACVRLIPGHDDLWQSDHASDPLKGTFDPWAAFVVLDHGGDLRAAEAEAEAESHRREAEGFDPLDEQDMVEARRAIADITECMSLVESGDVVLAAVKVHLPAAGYSGDEYAALMERLAVAVDMDPARVAKAVPPPPRSRFASIPFDEILNPKPMSWLIKHVAPFANVAMLFGASGSGKSFLALDIAAAVVRGVPWRGFKTLQGEVAYFVAEGAGGFRQRIRAYIEHNGPEAAQALRAGLRIHEDGPNLLVESDVKAFIEVLRAEGSPRLVIIDTLAQATPGANENSSEDMGLAANRCKIISQKTGAMVVMVHHSGKDVAKGARGWSGLKGAVDVELEVSRDGDDRTLTVSKLKEGVDGAQYGFKLLEVPLGMDEDGEVYGSCVVEHGPVAAKVWKPKGALQKAVLDAVDDLQGLAVDGAQVSRAEVLDRAFELSLAVEPLKSDTYKAQGNRRQSIRGAFEALVFNGLLSDDDHTVARKVDA